MKMALGALQRVGYQLTEVEQARSSALLGAGKMAMEGVQQTAFGPVDKETLELENQALCGLLPQKQDGRAITPQEMKKLIQYDPPTQAAYVIKTQRLREYQEGMKVFYKAKTPIHRDLLLALARRFNQRQAIKGCVPLLKFELKDYINSQLKILFYFMPRREDMSKPRFTMEGFVRNSELIEYYTQLLNVLDAVEMSCITKKAQSLLESALVK
jgi:hypothetical protein